jgi:hypothetical protein
MGSPGRENVGKEGREDSDIVLLWMHENESLKDYKWSWSDFKKFLFGIASQKVVNPSHSNLFIFFHYSHSHREASETLHNNK